MRTDGYSYVIISYKHFLSSLTEQSQNKVNLVPVQELFRSYSLQIIQSSLAEGVCPI